MLVNELGYRTYDCGPPPCQCMYQTALAPQCQIDGRGVLAQYGYRTGDQGKWVAIMLAILCVYRLLGWVVTVWKRT